MEDCVLQSIPSRIQKFLLRRLKKRRGLFFALKDTRQVGKVTHQLAAVASALLLGLICNRRTLRDVERLTKELSDTWRAFVPAAISDTRLDDVLRTLRWEELQEGLAALNREMKRSKLFVQSPEVPINLVVIDGKNLATLDHGACGTAQPRNTGNEKWHDPNRSKGAPYWLTPALRATLASTEARPCLLQMPLQPHTNETAALADFLTLLQAQYGRSDMLDVLSLDAGLTSLANANVIHLANLRYIFGLEENQPELYREAVLLLTKLAECTAPKGETLWEKQHGTEIRRKLWRTSELKNFQNSVGTWKHLEEVWLVRQETRNKNGTVTLEDRYFLSSIPADELNAQHVLSCVRLHWAIENDVFNSLDVQWLEDSGIWCTQGTATWALGVLRMMAYTIVQCLRRRHCRKKRGRRTWLEPMAWRALFEEVRDALRGFGLATKTA